jgi:nitroimidazol reductase NimA-like FMN-containing flavoprotein (pyridoxamine 5'-phosphate oxidase superfamily)
MLIHDMTAGECREILARSGIGRLACTRDNVPYIVPIYFAYEPDHLYGFSTVGRKIEWMRANPNVCVELDDIQDHTLWTSIIIHGRYQELPDTPEYQAERRQAQMLLEKRFLWWQTAHAAEQLRRRNGKPSPVVFYCIHVEEISGRRAVPDAIEAAGFANPPSRISPESRRTRKGLRRKPGPPLPS